MTEAQAEWLSRLKDYGPRTSIWSDCRVHECEEAGWCERTGRYNGAENRITPAGIAALAAHEEANDGTT